MKTITLLPLAALASAIVLPDPTVFSVFKQDEEHPSNLLTEWLPTKDGIEHGLEYINQAISKGLKSVEEEVEETLGTIITSVEGDDDEEEGWYWGKAKGKGKYGKFGKSGKGKSLEEEDDEEEQGWGKGKGKFGKFGKGKGKFGKMHSGKGKKGKFEFDDEVDFDLDEDDVWGKAKGKGKFGKFGKAKGKYGKGKFSDDDDEDWELDGKAKFGKAKGKFGKGKFGKEGGKHHGDHGRHGKHHKPTHTIYQLISHSKYTTKLAKLINEYDDIVEALNSTSLGNFTLFAPVDEAFEHIPKDKKPSKEELKDILLYHVGLGFYPAGRILFTHTLPSAYNESALGGEPQRLRTSVGLLSGVRVNFASKVIAADIFATNGVIHGINRIIRPTQTILENIEHFPAQFSTLLLAAKISNLTSPDKDLAFNGSTVFVPTNNAFQRLGLRANNFLFNTEKGHKYLKALLKYHAVFNETLYSDALYSNLKQEKEIEGTSEDNVASVMSAARHRQFILESSLKGAPISVDVARWGPVIRVTVNGYVPVVVQDGIASNGVAQIVGRVLIPPHSGHHSEEENVNFDENISVEELCDRLEAWVDKDEDVKGEEEMMLEL